MKTEEGVVPQQPAAMHHGAPLLHCGCSELLSNVDCRLSHLSTSVVVPAFELDDGGPFLFWAKASDKSTDKHQPGYSTLFRKPMFYRDPQTQAQPTNMDGRKYAAATAEEEQRQEQGLSGLSAAYSSTNDRADIMNKLLRLQQQQHTRTVGQAPQGRRMFFARTNLQWFHEPEMRSYPDTDFYLKTVARASSAAPTYFPGQY